MRASLSISVTIFIFFAIEIIFYSSFAVSDSFGFTLAGQRWAEKYWHPINSFGYGDVEHGPAEFEGKKVLFVVGDSFVAGHGISRIEDRFSNILQRNLGEQYLVVNIAQNGWDSADEYQAILAYPYKPKRIILSYFINDILGASRRLGYGCAAITSKVTGFLQEHGVRVVNLEPLLEGRDPNSLVVNSTDVHPNEALNREVGELLTKTIQADSR